MEPLEYDVYLSYREQSGAELAAVVAAGLARRGFRVFDGGNARDHGANADNVLQTIEDIPDFVLLLTPGCLEPCADERDAMRVEVAQALRTQRNVVPVAVRDYEHPATLAPDLAPLRARHTVPYHTSRSDESIARIAHRLSSDATVDERHMMRDARRIGTAVGLLLLVLMVIAAVRTLPGVLRTYLGSRPLAPMTLYWSAFGQRPAGGGWVEFPVKDGSPMVAGDEVRLVFSVSGEGYAYVVCKDVRGQISVLFPASRSLKNASHVGPGQLYAAPGDRSWWTPEEQVATDRVYVFASYDPIENLESLLGDREDSAAERQALLDSTIEGLLDGKHGSAPMRVRTRAGRPVLRSLEGRPRLLTASATLDTGTSVTHTLNEERGLLSAMAEIRVGPAR